MVRLGIVFLFFLILYIVIFWIKQLLDLMSHKDDSFPGKYDKVIWVAILIIFGFIGAYIYVIFKSKQETIQSEYIKTVPEDFIPVGNNDPDACLKCGQTIPADTTKCPSCDWTYKEDK